MPAWNDLLQEVENQPNDQAKSAWLVQREYQALKKIGRLRSDRNVLLYASAFLQKPEAPPFMLQITHEDINGFMSAIYGMDWSKGLTLVLHTPGGVTNATETVVDYLWSKFPDIEVIVPVYAMSAGTMISLASNRVVMGRQSQLGPIDPQMPLGGRFVSARSVVNQFGQAKNDILADRNAAHVWAPVLQSIGPALIQEAQNALEYGESMVAKWLSDHMFRQSDNPKKIGKSVAAYFGDSSAHKSHGRRIDREEARQQNLNIEDLEDNQTLQEAVMSLYHLITIAFEKGPAAKVIAADTGRMWVKNVGRPAV